MINAAACACRAASLAPTTRRTSTGSACSCATDLASLGFQTELVPQDRLGDHVVGRRPGRNGQQILLVGHFDTVFSHGTLAERPWRVRTAAPTAPASTT